MSVMGPASVIDVTPPTSPQSIPQVGSSPSLLGQLAGRICFVVFSLMALLRGILHPFDSISQRWQAISTLYQQGKQQRARFSLWLNLGSMTLWVSLNQAGDLAKGSSDGTKRGLGDLNPATNDESEKPAPLTLDNLMQCDRLRKEFINVGFDPGTSLAHLSSSCLDWLEKDSEKGYMSKLFSPSNVMSRRPTFKKLLALPKESLEKLESSTLEMLLKKDVKDLEKCCSTLGITLAQLVRCGEANLNVFLSSSKEIKEWIDQLRGAPGFPAKWQEELPISLLGLFGNKHYSWNRERLPLFKQLACSFQELRQLPEATLKKVIEEASGYSSEKLELLLKFPGFSWQQLGQLDLDRFTTLLSLYNIERAARIPGASFGHFAELAKVGERKLDSSCYSYRKEWLLGEFFTFPLEKLSALPAEEIEILLNKAGEFHNLCENRSWTLAALLQLGQPKWNLILEKSDSVRELADRYNASLDEIDRCPLPLFSFLIDKIWEVKSHCGWDADRFRELVRRLTRFANDRGALGGEFARILRDEAAARGRGEPRGAAPSGRNWWSGMPGTGGASPQRETPKPKAPSPSTNYEPLQQRIRELQDWWKGEEGGSLEPWQPVDEAKEKRAKEEYQALQRDGVPETLLNETMNKILMSTQDVQAKARLAQDRELLKGRAKETILEEARKSCEAFQQNRERYEIVKKAAQAGGPARKFFGYKDTDSSRPKIEGKLYNLYRFTVHTDKVPPHPTKPAQTALRKKEAEMLFHCLAEARDALSDKNPVSY